MFGLGTPELLVVLVIGLLLFGGKRLTELARSTGEAAREVKEAFEGDKSHDPKPTDSRHPKQS